MFGVFGRLPGDCRVVNKVPGRSREYMEDPGSMQ